jgi:aspartyl protease family protein
MRRVDCVLAVSCLMAQGLLPASATDVRVQALFKDRAVLEVDGKQVVLKAGSTHASGLELKRADSQSAVLLMDGQEQEVRIGNHIGSRFSGPPEGAKVALYPDQGGMYFTPGIINGTPVEFLVDTGATHVVLNSNEAKRIGIDFERKGRPGQASTAAGVVSTWNLELGLVSVGPIKLRDVSASIIVGDSPPQVLLGNSFLGKLKLKRDGQVLELQQPPP